VNVDEFIDGETYLMYAAKRAKKPSDLIIVQNLIEVVNADPTGKTVWDMFDWEELLSTSTKKSTRVVLKRLLHTMLSRMRPSDSPRDHFLGLASKDSIRKLVERGMRKRHDGTYDALKKEGMPNVLNDIILEYADMPMMK
jgi:hypothetical protein